MANTYTYTPTTPTYDIDYTDKRFKAVETEKQTAIGNMENTYNDMINQSDKFYQDQINAAKDYAATQQQLQQQNTDFAIEKINQEKDKAGKDYTKEQSGAYTDWQKQSDQYGVNAEQMAAQGLSNTGYSESSQVSMYNTYQNRIAMARESYNNAVLNYDNAIKDAMLQNNAKLAEIAYNALQTELQLALEGFQYKNTLLTEKATKLQELDNTYYNRWQDVVNQMNTENAMAEQIRQYNESQKLEYAQLNEQLKQQEIENALKQKEYEESIRQFNEQIAYQKSKDTAEARQKAQELQLERDKLKEEQRQFNAQLKEEKRQFNKSNSSSKSSGGGGSYSGGSSSSISKSGSKKYAVQTDFYKGSKAKNVGGFGYFGNGYQPRGVTVNGKARKLVATGKTVTVTTKTLKGRKVTVKQKVWKAQGTNTYWLWDGRQNKYVKFKMK
ncbi:MAG: hypothetical protein ACI4LK_02335 [Lentihominibacter sp.]